MIFGRKTTTHLGDHNNYVVPCVIYPVVLERKLRTKTLWIFFLQIINGVLGITISFEMTLFCVLKLYEVIISYAKQVKLIRTERPPPLNIFVATYQVKPIRREISH